MKKRRDTNPDKKRLDWLDKKKIHEGFTPLEDFYKGTLRKSIDSAMKSEQKERGK